MLKWSIYVFKWYTLIQKQSRFFKNPFTYPSSKQIGQHRLGHLSTDKMIPSSQLVQTFQIFCLSFYPPVILTQNIHIQNISVIFPWRGNIRWWDFQCVCFLYEWHFEILSGALTGMVPCLPPGERLAYTSTLWLRRIARRCLRVVSNNADSCSSVKKRRKKIGGLNQGREMTRSRPYEATIYGGRVWRDDSVKSARESSAECGVITRIMIVIYDEKVARNWLVCG